MVLDVFCQSVVLGIIRASSMPLAAWGCRFTKVITEQTKAPFISHFAACQMCSEKLGPKFGHNTDEAKNWNEHCHDQFWKQFEFVNRTTEMLIG